MSSRFSCERLFWPALAVMLAWLCAMQVRSALRESVTADEPVEISSGYSYLTTGDFRMEPIHPPLSKMFAALPLLWFRLVSPPDQTAWDHVDETHFAAQWMAANQRKQDGIVLAARLTSIFLTLCFGVAIALWTRSTFGPAAALLAIVFYAFDPTITAHGHYAKNDVPFAFLAFLTCIAFAGWLKRPRIVRALIVGTALGLSVATKLSAFFLLPVFLALFLIWRWQGRRAPSVRDAAIHVTAMLMAACLVVYLAYEVPALVHGRSAGGLNRPLLQALFDRSKSEARERLAHGPPPGHPLFRGLITLHDLNVDGHPTYLLGQVRTRGWWYYFPVAFAVKMPVATLLFTAIAALLLALRLRRRRLRAAPFNWFILAVPIVVYGVFSLFTPINVGIRHLLPVFPFLFILSAAAFTSSNWRYAPLLAMILGVALAVESIAISPSYLAFFNVLAGGPANGPAILADSNIDWGQDAKALARWLQRHPPAHLCLDYWGTADLARLGVTGPSLMERIRTDGRIPADCTAAVSVNLLTGLAPDHGQFGWLRACSPLARIGYSIYVFDMPVCAAKVDSLVAAQDLPAFGSIWHQDYRGPPTATDPARPGEILIAYMTGLGPLSQRIPRGKAVPPDMVVTTLLPVFCNGTRRWVRRPTFCFRDWRRVRPGFTR